MPKITDLTADTAPAAADVIPFVDTSAGTTEKVTVANLAAAASFVDAYVSHLGTATADDTTAIQTALTAGGLVKGLAGQSYTISAPLVIGSNTTLDMTGCTITLAALSDCNMLIDSAHNAATATVPSPVENVTVVGGIWDKAANSGSGNTLHIMVLGGSNVRVESVTYRSTAGKYALLLQNAYDFVVRDVFLDTVASDGVHVQGPAQRGTIRNVYGTAGDDLVAVTPCDYTAYVWGNEGDVTDIDIDGVHGINAGSRMVNVLSGRASGVTVLNTARVSVRNVSGTQSVANTQPAIRVGDDTAQANTRSGQIADVTIDNVSVTVNTSSQPVVNINGDTNSLEIPSVVIRRIYCVSDISAVVSVNTKLASLMVSDVYAVTASVAMTAVVWIANNAWPLVRRLRLSRVDVTYTGTRGGSVVRAATSGQTLSTVTMDNVYVSNASWVADVITSTSFRFDGCEFVSMGGIFNVRSPAAVVVHGWSGCTSSNTSSTITSTGTLRSLALDFPMDITNAQVVSAKVSGDRCTTRATAGTIAAGQPVVYDGSSWYELASQTTY